MLVTAVYNHDEPRLFGMPLFYWYQLAFVFVGVAAVGIVLRGHGKRRPPRSSPAGWPATGVRGMTPLWADSQPRTGREHFGGSALPLDQLSIVGWQPFAGSAVQIYVGILALAANLVVAILVTVVLRAARVSDGPDLTRGADYHADEGDPNLRPVAT